MKRKSLLILAALVALLVTSCSAKETKSPASALSSAQLKTYSSTFMMIFDGPVKWKYQLVTRSAEKLSESALHIEGITGAQNPGDVRLVTDGKTSWMTGQGTDNECVQFPNNQGMDPTLLTPHTMWPAEKLASVLTYKEDTQLAGRDAQHYTGSAADFDGWKNASFDVYTDKASGALLQLNVKATGKDTLFNTGEGTLMARYAVEGFDAPKIEPVTGCEVGLPVPDSAANLVRLPGMSSYDSSASLAEISAFYQAQMPKENWTAVEAPAQADGTTVLSYTRSTEQVEIHIQAGETSGSKVKLLFLQK